MRNLFATVVFAFCAISLFAADYYPDASRFGDFQANIRQGVVGGIPDRAGGNVILAATYGFAEAASAATNAAAIYSALAASSDGDVILLPAGEFSLTQVTISSGDFKSNRTIRGAGMSLTTINVTNQNGFFINGDPDYGSVFNPTAAIATMTAGSSTITVTDGTGLPSPSDVSNYRIARIELVNEAVTPVVSVQSYGVVRTPSVLVTARSGSTLTLSQPLPSSFPYGSAGANIQFGSQQARNTRGIGIEDMTIDGTDAGVMLQGVYFSFVSGCWAKNVKVLGHGTYAIRFSDTVNCEARECWTDVGTGGGTNFAGLKLEQTSYFLAEDNILVNNSPVIEMDYATTACVIAYNYTGNSYINRNHGPHNSFNLFEGNSYWFDMSDGYYGGSSEETLLRNWMRSGVFSAMKRFTRNNNLIGNVVGVAGQTYPGDSSDKWGYPNIGNFDFSGTWALSANSYSVDWNSVAGKSYTWTGNLKTRSGNISGVWEMDSGMATSFNTALANARDQKRNLSLVNYASTKTISTSSVSGNDVTFTVDDIAYSLPIATTVMWAAPGPNGFQEIDLDVANTAIRKANYYVFTGNIPAGESLGADTLPDSYYLTGKPAWFGTIPFPAFDPYSPPASEAAAIVAIPAGWRYTYGNSNYLNGNSTANVTNLNVGTIRKAP